MGMLGWTACAAVLVWAITLCRTDIRDLRLPDPLTLGGAAAILGAAALCGRGMPALCGGLALAALYLAVRLALPAALGGGDVKLALGVGALTGSLGVGVWLLAALAAPVGTAAIGLAGAARGCRGPIPHGPSMLVTGLSAAALAIF